MTSPAPTRAGRPRDHGAAPGHASRTRDHDEDARRLACACRPRARKDVGDIRGLGQDTSRVDEARREADVHDADRARDVGPGQQHDAHLRGAERHRERGRDRRPLDGPRRAVDPRGDVDGDHRCRRSVDRVDRGRPPSPRARPGSPCRTIASITTSARASSAASPAGVNGRPMSPCSASRAALRAAGCRRSSRPSRARTETRMPRRARCRAATKPSPPLFPLPHTTTALRPYTPPYRSIAACATARPARSMRTSAETPRDWVARSTSVACAGVRTGFTLATPRAPQPRRRPRWSSRG